MSPPTLLLFAEARPFQPFRVYIAALTFVTPKYSWWHSSGWGCGFCMTRATWKLLMATRDHGVAYVEQSGP